jgi:hypothetical protein
VAGGATTILDAGGKERQMVGEEECLDEPSSRSC